MELSLHSPKHFRRNWRKRKNQQNANCSASVNVCLFHEDLLFKRLYCTSCRLRRVSEKKGRKRIERIVESRTEVLATCLGKFS